MKAHLTLFLANLLLRSSTCQLVVATLKNEASLTPDLASQPDVSQHPMVVPETVPEDGGHDKVGTPVQAAVPLNEILGTHRSLTTFSSLTRLHSSTESLLADLGENTTVLAPLNSAIEALPRKPWEDPHDYETRGAKAYDGGDGQDRARENLRRFVEAHLVTRSPWNEGEKASTVGGGELWWRKNMEGKMVIEPDGVEVDKVASQVANGEVVR